jgi:hypothetical protein
MKSVNFGVRENNPEVLTTGLIITPGPNTAVLTTGLVTPETNKAGFNKNGNLH